MRKTYVTPWAKILVFCAQDIISSSGAGDSSNENNNDNDNLWTPNY